MARLRISFPTYKQPNTVVFGTGSVKTLIACESLTDTAIFISGQEKVQSIVANSFKKYGQELDKANVISKPPGEPTYAMIQAGAALLHKKPFARVVGIGGGSVLDWCRLAWAESQGLLSYQANKAELTAMPQSKPEFWLIPTTCGTGAEAASVAVFSADGQKLPVVSPTFIADRVILDGQFLSHVAPSTLAQSLSDALSHAIEAFVSIIPGHLAKEAALSALQLILEYYPKAGDASRNERFMEAGYLGGVAASNCSVGVIHAFAHTIAGYGVTHGRANACGLIAGIYANRDTPAMQVLLKRCQVDNVTTLVERLKPIVRSALADTPDVELLAILHNGALRKVIRKRMTTDTCMRSNPKALDENALDTFLDRVAETVAHL
jgi:alcohol dehydrogenase class IV